MMLNAQKRSRSHGIALLQTVRLPEGHDSDFLYGGLAVPPFRVMARGEPCDTVDVRETTRQELRELVQQFDSYT